MLTYYCHACGRGCGLLPALPPETNFTGSSYQLQKYTKHTVPDPDAGYRVQGIFDRSDYSAYRDFVVNTHASGAVEVDGSGRTNIVWYAGERTGITWIDGIPTAVCDAVKLVLAHNDVRVHPFPTGSNFRSEICAACGKSVAT